MRSRYKVIKGLDCYFVTFTIIEWLPVFVTKSYCDILLASLDYCRDNKRLQVLAYVIMLDHVHLVICHEDTAGIMRDIKSFTAKEIVKQLCTDKKEWALHYMRDRALLDNKGNDYKVWQDGFHPKAITTEKMLWQKIDYIHTNPVAKGYVSTPEGWYYSSARQYVGADVGGEFLVDLAHW